MDLSQFDVSDQSAIMPVRHPVTGEVILSDAGEPVDIILLSSDSKEYETALHDAQRAAARAATQSDGVPDPAGINKRSIHVLAHAIVGWRNITLKGEDLPFSLANAIRLLTEVRIVREQVSRFVANRANFLAEAKEKS